MTRADMDRVRDEFVRAARRRGRSRLRLARAALRARLPAVGVPVPADQSPRRRVWRFAREPLPVSRSRFSARCAPCGPPTSRCRCASPRTTGREGGNTPDDAVAIAKLFRAAGADLIDVSSGQTTRRARPVYGRMYQTPFADRVRNEAGIATMAVGAIFEPDHVNSILMAGRADLCALARPHLADPYWTLHAAARAIGLQISGTQCQQQPRDRRRLRGDGARAARRPFPCQQPLFHKPACPTGAARGTPRDPGGLRRPASMSRSAG